MVWLCLLSAQHFAIDHESGGYLYAHTDRDIYCTLYASSSTEIPLAGGEVQLEQQSDYPFSGEAEMVLRPDRPMRFALRLRIPTWARSEAFLPGGLYTYADGAPSTEWQVFVNGKRVNVPLEQGFAVIDRRWKSGDRVELRLPMVPRYVQARPEVEADVDRLAIVRGPLVYCAEGVDNGLVQRYYLPEMASFQVDTMTEGPLQGMVALTTTAALLDTPPGGRCDGFPILPGTIGGRPPWWFGLPVRRRWPGSRCR